MISVLVRWLVVTVVVGTVVAGLVVVSTAHTVKASPESKPSLDCLSCHVKKLESHDKLGSGNKACWVCHSSTDMKLLRLVDETPLSLSENPQLCRQCHQKRYDAWQEGTHGIPGPSTEKCADCHNPHQPQVALWGITLAHPLDAPPPPKASVELLIMLGVSVILVMAIGTAVVTERRR